MRKSSNPISIDSGRESKRSKGTSTKHSSAKREKTPAAAKTSRTRQSIGAGSAKSAKTSTRSRSTKLATSNKATKAVKNPATDNVPPRLPENHHPGLHDRSYAAHLDAGPGEPHTKPAGIPRHGNISVGRKQP